MANHQAPRATGFDMLKASVDLYALAIKRLGNGELDEAEPHQVRETEDCAQCMHDRTEQLWSMLNEDQTRTASEPR